MRILMVASEAAPFAKTGGLADVVGALPRALARLGQPVDVVLPRYRGIHAGEPIARLTVPLGGQVADATMYAHESEGMRTLFVDHPGYFDRDHLYGAAGHDYPDNPERFAFLCRAALEWADVLRRVGTTSSTSTTGSLGWCRSATGMAAPALRRVPCMFTIHNLAYQGIVDASWLPRLGLGSELMHVDALEFWSRISLSEGRHCVQSADHDRQPSVCPGNSDARVRLRLRRDPADRSGDLVGILNGIDYDQWDPARDPYLPEPFDARDLDGKLAPAARYSKRSVCRRDPGRTTAGGREWFPAWLTRRDSICSQALGDELPRLNASFVLLGTGERRYEDLWLALASRYPDRVGARIGFDEALAHQIEGGADLFLMPSRFEPCGLNQMYSLRYGTVPLVRATGGLYDTVRNFDEPTGSGTGFTFDEYSPQALLSTLRWALRIYEDRAAWRRMQVAGMQQDFSWDASAREYVKVYERAARPL